MSIYEQLTAEHGFDPLGTAEEFSASIDFDALWR